MAGMLRPLEHNDNTFSWKAGLPIKSKRVIKQYMYEK